MMGKFWNLRLLCVCMAVAMPVSICAGDALAEDILDPKSHPEDVIEDLIAMNIEALADTTVSVASKKNEKITDAPAIVTVVTADEIERYGANNLIDILDRQTSIQTIGSSFLPENNVTIRGQNFDIINNRVLFLINGRPIRDSFTGGTMLTFLRTFPINVINHIEIVRGPSSILYGSNAVSGVINVVTKTSDKLDKNEVSLTFGSLGAKAVDAATSIENDDVSIVLGAKGSNADGWSGRVVDFFGQESSMKSLQDDYSVMLSAQASNFTANIFHGRSKLEALNGAAIATSVNARSFYTTMADLGYKHEINKDWELEGHVTYNRLLNDSNAGGGNDIAANDILFDLSAIGDVTDSVSLMLGASYESHETDIVGTTGGTDWYNSYAQVEYRPFNNLKFVGGLQLNKSEEHDRRFSPRLASVYDFNQNWGAKLLYGQAFRSPYQIETIINVPNIIQGNYNLKPERVEATELSLFYTDPDTSAALTLFHSDFSDAITRVNSFPINYDNSGSLQSEGVEFELKHNFNNGLSFTGNITYQENENHLGLEQTTYTPELMAKAGVSYDADNGITLSLYDSYFSDPAKLSEFYTIPENNPDPQSYHLMTFNANVDMNKALNFHDEIPETKFTFFVDNVLDEDIRFPDLTQNNINSIKIKSGRAFYGRLTVRF